MRGLKLLWLLPGVASAHDLPARLSVERSAGAELCDGRAELTRRVEAIWRSPSADSPGPAALSIDLAVRFERDRDGAFSARVTASGSKPGLRELRDASASCEALSQAVSVAIALLLDNALAEHPPSQVAGESPKSARVSAPAELESLPHAAARSASTLSAALEAGAAYGLAGDAAFLTGARLGVAAGRWAFDLGASASWPSTTDFAPGQVRTSLWFGRARGCYLLGGRILLGPCLELGVGRLRGAGVGYEGAQASTLLWTAAGVGLVARAPLGSRAFFALGAGLWLPTRRNSFSVQNAGIAWESPPVAGALAAELGLWLL